MAGWSIEELGERVSEALAAPGYEGPRNGQVRTVPDTRTIRYYTTLGLLDRPAEMRGRTAFYGRRHLLQIVAIKRLQAAGKSLCEVQAELTGISDAELERMAKVPKTPATPLREKKPEGRRKDFWTMAPSTAATTPAALAATEREPAALLTGVPIDPQITILFAPTEALSDEQASALRLAAAPLVRYLYDHGLVRVPVQEGSSK